MWSIALVLIITDKETVNKYVLDNLCASSDKISISFKVGPNIHSSG